VLFRHLRVIDRQAYTKGNTSIVGNDRIVVDAGCNCAKKSLTRRRSGNEVSGDGLRRVCAFASQLPSALPRPLSSNVVVNGY
jgi:hypothetical protein